MIKSQLPQSSVAVPQQDKKELKLGLALSGGGFRATLFHLGVIKCLSDAGLLAKVSHVTAVSGGSILAAHLFENWNVYLKDFPKAAETLLAFVQYDIRGRILRRLPYSIFYGHWRRTELLREYYHELFLPKLSEASQSAPVDEALPPRPHLAILATNLNTGSMYAFSEQYVYVATRHDIKALRTDLPLTSLKVAISSAFPGFFPPITLTHRDVALDVAEFQESQCFTDGGVFDNLGIRFFQRAYEVNSRQPKGGPVRETGDHFWKDVPDVVLASNASSAFDVSQGTRTLFGTALRAVDILMNRLGVMDVESIIGDSSISSNRFRYLALDSIIETEKNCLNVGLQKAIRFMRTDLDAFSKFECQCLIQHGYCVARQHLNEMKNLQIETDGESSAELETALSRVTNRPPWDPFENIDSLSNKKPILGEAVTEASTADVEKQCRLLHKGAHTRLKFFSWKDPLPSIMNSAILIACLAILAFLGWSALRTHQEVDWRTDPVISRIENEGLRVGRIALNKEDLGFFLFKSHEEHGNVIGLDRLISERIGRELPRWLGFPERELNMPEGPKAEKFGQLLDMPRNGEADIIISAISFTVTREKKYQMRFSVPYYETTLSLVGQSDEVQEFTIEKDYTGRMLFVLAGSTSAEVAEWMRAETNWTVQPCKNVDELKSNFVSQPDSFVLSDTPVADTWKREGLNGGMIDYKELNTKDFPDTVPPERRKEYYVIGVTEDSPRLLWAINGILMEMAEGRDQKDKNLQYMIEKSKQNYELTKDARAQKEN